MVAEKSSVCSRRQPRNDALQIGQEAHIEHAVAFVEHECVQMIEARLVHPHVIQQPAGSSQEYLHSGPQRLFLWPHRCAPHQDADPQLCVISQSQTHVVDLLGQFSGRRDNQRPRHPQRQPQQLLQDRQQEGGSLARPRLAVAIRSRPEKIAGMA